jgi:predicted dehydrogenase
VTGGASRAGCEPVRWGFLGAGWIAARALAPAVHAADGAALVAAAARDTDRARRLGPSGRTYDDYAGLLADPDVEAVYVALSNEAHLPWTLAALEAGKHVLCEKPLGLTAEQVRQMAAAAVRADRLLVEATFSRWHPRTRRAEALLRSGAIGAVREIDAGFTFPTVPAGNYRWEPDRGGGALYDVGPYALGAALWASLGSPPLSAQPDPVQVLAVTVDRAPTGVDLTCAAALRVGSAEAEVRVSIAERPAQWLRVHGEAGTLVLDEPAFTSWLAPSTLLLDDASGRSALEFGPVDPYQRMVEHVSRAVRGDGCAWVLPVEESLRVARAMDLVRAGAP